MKRQEELTIAEKRDTEIFNPTLVACCREESLQDKRSKYWYTIVVITNFNKRLLLRPVVGKESLKCGVWNWRN